MICVVVAVISMEWWRSQLGWVLYVRALGMAWVRPAVQHDASGLPGRCSVAVSRGLQVPCPCRIAGRWCDRDRTTEAIETNPPRHQRMRPWPGQKEPSTAVREKSLMVCHGLHGWPTTWQAASRERVQDVRPRAARRAGCAATGRPSSAFGGQPSGRRRLDHSPWLEKWQSNTEMVQHVQVRQVWNAHQIPFRKGYMVWVYREMEIRWNLSRPL